MNPQNRFFYAHSNMEVLVEMLEKEGFSREDTMTEKIQKTNLNLFFDRLEKEYFFVDAINLKRLSDIIRKKYNVEVERSSPSAIFGYENPEDAKKRKRISKK